MPCFRSCKIQSVKTLVVIISILLHVPAFAQLSMPKVFGNLMVLQRDASIVMWGKASAGSNIVVKIADIQSNTIITEHGDWKIFLTPMKAAGPYTYSVTENAQYQSSIIFEDVMVGDVWLASGQSNMELEVKHSDHAKEEIFQADYPSVRLLKVAQDKSPEPKNDIILPLKSNEVSHPVAVRYAWADNPECSLTNAEGLPALPFRTDNWEN